MAEKRQKRSLWLPQNYLFCDVAKVRKTSVALIGNLATKRQDRTLATDLEKLQGRWRQVKFEENGLIDPPDSHGADGAIMTVSGSSFRVAIPGAETLIEGNFVLHASAFPKGIDWIDRTGEDAGKILPAIYRLSSDGFEFAAADSDMARPEDFEGGEGITIRAFIKA